MKSIWIVSQRCRSAPHAGGPGAAGFVRWRPAPRWPEGLPLESVPATAHRSVLARRPDETPAPGRGFPVRRVDAGRVSERDAPAVDVAGVGSGAVAGTHPPGAVERFARQVHR